ncbi:MAG: hypothetical protein OEX00_00945 [Gammaproteobacteria bacterium]|nr:hypothetical protein [Gammaproteobacteria bacterium]MDH5691945.1 hypothetical protein [Gammaproteobacteria bacterium]
MAFEVEQCRKRTLASFEKGYTVVNLIAVILFIALAAGITSQVVASLGDLESKRFYSSLSDLEGKIYSYYEQNSRWPGDCNRNGLIEYHPENVVSLASAKSNFASNEVAVDKTRCDVLGRNPETLDSPFSDLRHAALLERESTNRVVSKHTSGSFFQLGSASAERNGKSVRVNAIVAYGVSAHVAKWVDHYVDGDVDGNRGRIRRWDIDDAGSAWPGPDDKSVALVYYFEKTLP